VRSLVKLEEAPVGPPLPTSASLTFSQRKQLCTLVYATSRHVPGGQMVMLPPAQKYPAWHLASPMSQPSLAGMQKHCSEPLLVSRKEQA
jgi:hypothetical protein